MPRIKDNFGVSPKELPPISPEMVVALEADWKAGSQSYWVALGRGSSPHIHAGSGGTDISQCLVSTWAAGSLGDAEHVLAG